MDRTTNEYKLSPETYLVPAPKYSDIKDKIRQPGNANLRIGTQAGEGENSHPDLQRKYVLRHTYKVTDLKRPCQYGDWRSQAGGFYVLSQSILV